MSLSLYDISVPGFKQMMGTVTGLLEKGAAFCQENDIEITEMIEARLHPDMRPLKHQVVYTVVFPKMTLGALKSGEFNRSERNNLPDLEFPQLQQLVQDFSKELDSIAPEDINALTENSVMINKLPDIDTPFSAPNFILSFAHPNLYFHTSTLYDILRQMGVPLAKPDILGPFRSNL